MDKRVLSQAQRQWLLDEMERWQARGLVTRDQADEILDLYETPKESASRQHAVAIFTLMGVAALLLGLAIFLLIAYNWELMPAAVKVGIIFAVLAGTYAGGFYLRLATSHRTLSEVVFFLACLFYGGAIWLIAQIFNLNAHYPDGFWWWAVGVLPFALALDTLLLHALLVALLAIWAGTEILGFDNLGLWLFRRWPFIPNGAYTLPLLAVPGLLWAYRKNSPFTVSLYVALLAWWVILQPFAWHLDSNPIFFIGSVGVLLLVLAESHPEGSPFALPYRFYGALLALGTLVPLSFAHEHADFVDLDRGTVGFLIQACVILVLALAVLAAGLLLKLRQPDAERIDRPVYTFFARQWLPLGLIGLYIFFGLWAAGHAALQPPDEVALVPVILANLAMLAAAFWLMSVGLREDRGRPFAAGVFYFLLWAVIRYFDLFGFDSMLGAACLFFLCAAALFGVALFWHRRKKEASHV